MGPVCPAGSAAAAKAGAEGNLKASAFPAAESAETHLTLAQMGARTTPIRAGKLSHLPGACSASIFIKASPSASPTAETAE